MILYNFRTLFFLINISSLISISAPFSIGLSHASKYNDLRDTSMIKNNEFQTSLLKATTSVEEIVETDVSSSKGKTKLSFRAEREFESESMMLPSKSSLDVFFRDNKSVILIGEGNDVEEASDDMYQKLYSKWVEKCDMKGFVKPGENDVIYKVITSGAEFPGIKIMSCIHMGCKLIPPSESESDYSELQFVMLESQDYAEGPKFLVWLFNKLTGNNKNLSENEDEGENSSQAYTRFYAETKGDKEITFKSNTELGIDVEFPSMLLKVMPLSKEKTEEKGSDSIVKVLEKESKATLDIWVNAYEKWLKSN